MQLLVVGEGTGLVTINPQSPFRRNHFFSSKNGPSAKIEVLAVVWGLHPVSEVSFIQATLQNKQIPCNNAFFARDGWGGTKKTCQVFLQNNLTGDITCIVGREGTTLTLPTVWPGDEGAENEEGACF
jgi:hypothetical protein